MPGARLCAPCKAALKRARHETVSQLEPLPRRKSSLSKTRGAPTVAPQGTTTGARSPRPFRWRFAAVVALVAAAVSTGGYLALRLERGAVEPGGASAASAPMAATPSTTSPLPAPRREPDADATLQRSPQPGAAPQAAEAPKPVLLTAPGKPVPKRPSSPAPVPVAPAIARFAAATEPPPAPATIPEAPTPRPAAPPDRWQLMADGIARCGREDFIAGVICEQRVRLQYCDGYWGQAAQCPSGVNNDHGR